jgi:transcriptional regulator with XRE-family HTH domain
MLTESQVEWVVQLLDEKNLSQRAIALETGISRGTIGAIARGERPRSLCRRQTAELVFDPGPPLRCRGCGGLVQMPCLLCQVRHILAIERRLTCQAPAVGAERRRTRTKAVA